MSNKSHTMKDAAKHTRTPKVRFPEFRDAEGWKETELLTIARPVSERAINGDDDKVLSLSGEHGIVLQSDYFGKKVAGDNSERYIKIARNDFVYNDRTTKQSIYGTIKRLSKYEGGIVSPIYKCFRFNSDENPVFWDWYFESGVHESELGGLVNEGARAGRFNISIDKFLSTSVWHPHLPEQQKIADCLTFLYELIAAHGQKLDALKSHKKGLMQQLFPRAGETVPRLRFPEFQNAPEWECRDLSDCLNKVIDYRGKAPPKSDSGIPLITAKNVRFGWLDMSNDEYIEEDQYQGWMSKGMPEAGDILFTTEAPLGNVALFPNGGKFALGQRIITLRTDNGKCLSEFLFHSLLGPRMQGEIEFHSTGSTAKGIKARVFVNISFYYPGMKEQQKIAECLSSLDALIASQTQRLESLKTHKRGLMQQLFPSEQEATA
jgi:type I restriction enzyme S subunit